MAEIVDRSELKGRFCGNCLAPAEKVMEWLEHPTTTDLTLWHGWVCSDCGERSKLISEEEATKVSEVK